METKKSHSLITRIKFISLVAATIVSILQAVNLSWQLWQNTDAGVYIQEIMEKLPH